MKITKGVSCFCFKSGAQLSGDRRNILAFKGVGTMVAVVFLIVCMCFAWNGYFPWGTAVHWEKMCLNSNCMLGTTAAGMSCHYSQPSQTSSLTCQRNRSLLAVSFCTAYCCLSMARQIGKLWLPCWRFYCFIFCNDERPMNHKESAQWCNQMDFEVNLIWVKFPWQGKRSFG